MATAKQLDDITECPICTEVYTDPRVYCRVYTRTVSSASRRGAKTNNPETNLLVHCVGKSSLCLATESAICQRTSLLPTSCR